MITKRIHKYKYAIVFSIFITGSLGSCYYDKEDILYPNAAGPCDTSVVAKFSTVVLPLMNTNCNYSGCHNTTSAASGVILDTYNGVKAQAVNNRLIGSIKHSSGYSPMPKGGAKYSDCNIAKIQQWINSGYPNN
jgi:hypothetical protein